MIYWVLMLIALCAPFSVLAQDYHLIDMRELSLDYINYEMISKVQKDPLLYPESPKEELSFNLKTDIFRIGYWDSIVHASTTDAQYRAIGLLTRIGIRLSTNVELGLVHHSQHILDGMHSYMDHFPVTDGIQLRIYLYKDKETRRSVF